MLLFRAGDDAEIEAGIEDVEVELEQEQEDIDQENESRQVGVADAQSYADDVDVEQSGFLSAAADGVKASSEADAEADLDQLALQGNTNAQTAATSLAFTASPSFTNVLVEADNDDAEIGAGIEEVEVSVDQDQEDIDQSNKSEQVGPWNDDAEDWGPALAIATSESGSVSVKQTGTLFAGDTGVDAQSEADATATLQQLAGQGNANSQEATTAGTFTADAPFNVVTLVAGDDAELEAGIEDVEFEVEQEQEDIDQENDGDQFGVADALATSGYVQVDSFDDPSGGTAIEAASDAEATAGLLQVAEQSNSNKQTAATTLDFNASPSFTDVTFRGNDDDDLEAGIEDVEVSVEQDQEDIDQENESEQDGSAYATAYADYADVDVNGTLEAGENGIEANSSALAVAELDQTVSGELDAPGQSNANEQTASLTGTFIASPTGTGIAGVGDIDAGIEEVEVSVDQDQEDIDQENRSEQFGVADAFASSEHVKVESDGKITAGDFVAGIGDGIDAEFERGGGCRS